MHAHQLPQLLDPGIARPRMFISRVALARSRMPTIPPFEEEKKKSVEGEESKELIDLPLGLCTQLRPIERACDLLAR
jgi:hypothetical protein